MSASVFIIPPEGQRSILERHRTSLVVGAHAMLFSVSLLAAFLLAYNFRSWTVPPESREEPIYWFVRLYLPLLVLALPTKLIVFGWTGQYRGSWRYVGLRDLLGVISSSLIATFLFLFAYFLLENGWWRAFGRWLIDGPPVNALRQSSVFALDWAATIVCVSAARVLVRFYHEDISPRRPGQAKRRVLIVGAGNAGEAVLRELLRMGRDRYECVGFLDDQAPLQSRIHGAEVLERTDQIRAVCERDRVEEVMIALPHAAPKLIRALVEQCEGTGVLFRTIPAVSDVLEGRVQVHQIREVGIGDLLGRQAVQLDTERIAHRLKDRVVMVTGAGGSIGAELCRQIAEFCPRRVVLVERSEHNLFEIDRELRNGHPTLKFPPYLADITDESRIRNVLGKEQPSIVFHAAAHKHVPMMEVNAGEAVKNNILGTRSLADACLEFGVEAFVLISTDKAVNPTSIMGCTKRVAEMYVQGIPSLSGTHFITVRFGNVLGSSGSVVPIFRSQILQGGPVTVTDPRMVRYFMTISEAAQLVLQAGSMGRGGEIFVLHMGDPVRIIDLARDMITLSGLRPGADIEIVFTGRRAGEKLYEELLSEGEDIGDTAHPKIGIWKHRPTDWDEVCRGIERLATMSDGGSLAEIQEELRRIVPEFVPDSTAAEGAATRTEAASVERPTTVSHPPRLPDPRETGTEHCAS